MRRARFYGYAWRPPEVPTVLRRLAVSLRVAVQRSLRERLSCCKQPKLAADRTVVTYAGPRSFQSGAKTANAFVTRAKYGSCGVGMHRMNHQVERVAVAEA